MRVLLDIDWTGFTDLSDFYDYDGSHRPVDFGPLFQPGVAAFPYEGHSVRSIDLGSDRPAAAILGDLLYRYSWRLGVDGFYWRSLLCLRLNGTRCSEGDGLENHSNALFLKEMTTRLDTVALWVATVAGTDAQMGEDDDNINFVHKNSVSIQNIVLAVDKRGAGFHAKRDLTAYGSRLTPHPA